MASSISFVTFGMFIIDEIEYLDGRSRQQNLIGGAGVYAALGARLAAGDEQARSVSWIVDMGSEFPLNIKEQIDRWNTTCIFRTDHSRLTTRAWNGYGPNEYRSFRYLTPKIRLEVHSLNDQQALSSSFHMVCSPSRCMELCRSLMARRRLLTDVPRPVIVWEPIPDLCTPAELQNLQEAAEGASVVSPNADELAAFFAGQDDLNQDDMVAKFIGWKGGRAPNTHAIIREGAHGSTVYIAPTTLTGNNMVDGVIPKIHLPAFHTKEDAPRVIDPTGGGNTYLGGLAIGMTESLDKSPVTAIIEQTIPDLQLDRTTSNTLQHLIIGALYAVIAASYAIEQCGVPELSPANTAGSEQWNNESFVERMAIYLRRNGNYISEQLPPLRLKA